MQCITKTLIEFLNRLKNKSNTPQIETLNPPFFPAKVTKKEHTHGAAEMGLHIWRW